MAWATPPTFTVNDTPTAAELNVWRDDLLALHNPPCSRVTDSGNQLIASASTTDLTWNQETVDTDGMHSTSVNTDRLTIVTAGRYLFIEAIVWDITNPGSRGALIRDGAGTVLGDAFLPKIPADNRAYVTASAIASLSTGAFAKASVNHTAGGNLNVLKSLSSFAAVWLGA